MRATQSDEQIREIVDILDLSTAKGLVDVGCGNGAFAVAAALRHPDCSVWGFDPLESAVSECRRRAAEAGVTNLKMDVASANCLPLDDSCVDRVLIRNVLHHVASADAAFTELARVLKTDGIVLLEAPCNVSDEALGVLISDIHMLRDDSHRRTYHHPDVICSELSTHGIFVKSVTTRPYTHIVKDNEVTLITDHEAGELLCLREESDGRRSIQLNIVRVIGKKKTHNKTDAGDA